MLQYWYSALTEPHGLCLRVSDFNLARQRLYKERAEACDLSLDALSICQSPTDPNELWIVKRDATSEQ